MLVTIWDRILSLVFPNWCPYCHAESASVADGYVGSNCAKSIRTIPLSACPGCASPQPACVNDDDTQDEIRSFGSQRCPDCTSGKVIPAFNTVRAAVFAEGVVREGLLRFKYHGNQWPVRLFEMLLAQRLEAENLTSQHEWDWITFPPLYPVRERQRGFNQSRILSDIVAKHLKIPVIPDALKRIRPTPTQTRLGRDQRLLNMVGAFKANSRRKHICTNARILIVDDIFTTGATLEACSDELKSFGASTVDALCLARKPRHTRQYISVNSLKSSKRSANN